MIYEGRIAITIPGKEELFLNRVMKDYFPMVKKHGGNPIGVFQTVIGESDEVYYVLGFRDLAHREKVFKSMRADAEYLKLAELWGKEPSISNLSSKILKPVPANFLSSAAGAP